MSIYITHIQHLYFYFQCILIQYNCKITHMLYLYNHTMYLYRYKDKWRNIERSAIQIRMHMSIIYLSTEIQPRNNDTWGWWVHNCFMLPQMHNPFIKRTRDSWNSFSFCGCAGETVHISTIIRTDNSQERCDLPKGTQS